VIDGVNSFNLLLITVNYAFMNGMTDPLLNKIAKNTYNGYVNMTDQHYIYYKNQSTNRN